MSGPFDPARFSYLKVESRGQDRPSMPSTTRIDTDVQHDSGNGILSLFHLFPKLPAELRRRIWHIAASEPRIVELHEVGLDVWAIREDQAATSKPTYREIVHFCSRTRIPPLLETCHESRVFALRWYKKVDASSIYCPDATYFECEVDTLFLSNQTLNRSYKSWPKPIPHCNGGLEGGFMDPLTAMRSRLRSIALDSSFILQYQKSQFEFCSSMLQDHSTSRLQKLTARKFMLNLARYTALREVILVLNEDERVSSDKMLSMITFYDVPSGTEMAGSLADAAELLRGAFEESFQALIAQAEAGLVRLSPAYTPTLRKPPIIRTMVTRLVDKGA